MSSLSIVIPVYNAEKTIESLCKTLMDLYGKTHRLEIVLVNDNSRDSTHVVCTRLHREYPEAVTYLSLARNFGEHCAVMAGLNHVTGELCVTMDDDFQNPPEEIGRLVAEIEKGFDVVYSSYPVKRDSFFRNLGSRVNDRMANIILRKPADLYLSSFKVMNRFLVDEIIKYTGPDPYLDAIILRATASIGKVEVRHDERRHGRSGYTLGKLVSLWGNMVLSFSLIPLRIIGFVGLVMTVIGVAIWGFTFCAHIIPGGYEPNESERHNAVLMLFRGLNLLFIGVVGEYVGRIYQALNNDPQYVVRERFAARNRLPAVLSLHTHTEHHGPREHAS